MPLRYSMHYMQGAGSISGFALERTSREGKCFAKRSNVCEISASVVSACVRLGESDSESELVVTRTQTVVSLVHVRFVNASRLRYGRRDDTRKTA